MLICEAVSRVVQHPIFPRSSVIHLLTSAAFDGAVFYYCNISWKQCWPTNLMNSIFIVPVNYFLDHDAMFFLFLFLKNWQLLAWKNTNLCFCFCLPQFSILKWKTACLLLASVKQNLINLASLFATFATHIVSSYFDLYINSIFKGQYTV